MLNDYVAGFSSEGLQKLHLAALHAFQQDEATPADQAKVYGVREHADWKQWSDALETELQKRKVQFTRIPW